MAHTRPTSFLSTLAMIDIVMKGDHRFKAEIPLGVDAVAAYIRHRGFPVETHQCLPDEGAREIARAGQVEVDVYGFQIEMSNYPSLCAVAAIIRRRKPRALIVLGAPCSPSLAAPNIENEPLFDCLVRGAGEQTMLEIMMAVQRGDADLGLVDGLVGAGRKTTRLERRRAN
ncbi:MAG TPA: cobalamin-dependent protein [Alphaproteobacteria bacterium]|nr:cobalamin-dependent protein [Alphaproteobacteria bacterium]